MALGGHGVVVEESEVAPLQAVEPEEGHLVGALCAEAADGPPAVACPFHLRGEVGIEGGQADVEAFAHQNCQAL